MHICKTVVLVLVTPRNSIHMCRDAHMTCVSRTFVTLTCHDPSTLHQVDDFAAAQSTPLPECVAGIEGDKV